jgi:hypothetical protein
MAGVPKCRVPKHVVLKVWLTEDPNESVVSAVSKTPDGTKVKVYTMNQKTVWGNSKRSAEMKLIDALAATFAEIQESEHIPKAQQVRFSWSVMAFREAVLADLVHLKPGEKPSIGGIEAKMFWKGKYLETTKEMKQDEIDDVAALIQRKIVSTPVGATEKKTKSRKNKKRSTVIRPMMLCFGGDFSEENHDFVNRAAQSGDL